MSDKSKIEWTDATWNPVTGCSKVSEGCRNCYALKFAERWRGTPGHYFENGFDITLRPDKLIEPLRWKRPRRIFVNSMSDLFHPKVPDHFIWSVFEIMAQSPQHTYQILTKRPQRMMEMLSGRYWRDLGTPARPFFALIIKGEHREGDVPFLPNVWLGVSVENQDAADARVHLLNKTQAAIRFLSCEPLLGPLDIRVHLGWKSSRDWTTPLINWVIAGGESGPGARPMHPDWARSLRDQCQSAGVSFFFKQWGEWLDRTNEDKSKFCGHDWILAPDGETLGAGHGKHGGGVEHDWRERGGAWMSRLGKKRAGRELDGRTWDEMPD
ncbi:DUF5131 family protein [Paenibacillus thermotolerans]|uniref:DUF5131 family protein n=1 Tax=Paenibacillus thermotolerans TaxID=3027807 RepID=UPI002367C117|nr:MULTISPECIES: phage Gp37/Gp68 family protein [unclassified Paenibacillus]